jgi:sugar phosphate isomerase/epimerase
VTVIRFGAHVPWSQIETYLDQVLELGLTPEIAIKGPELDHLDQSLLIKVAQTLKEMSLRPYIHAPFFDLNVGALDTAVRQLSLQRLFQALSFATQLNATLMVIHPGVDKWRYPNLDQVWLTNARTSFQALTEQAVCSDCRLAIENIYEESPSLLVQLVKEIDSEWFGHCFDAGHWHLFGKNTMSEWLEAIASKLLHLHLHDNYGVTDDHLPMGEGRINFKPLQAKLRNMSKLPSMTLEAHSLEHLIQSLPRAKALVQ